MKIRPVKNRYVPCGRTDVQTNRQTAMTKLIVALRYFVNAPKDREMEAVLLDERNGFVFAYVIVYISTT
jgi:hypothetical protein